MVLGKRLRQGSTRGCGRNPGLEPTGCLRCLQCHEEPGRSVDKHKNAILTWVAYVGGPRESRRLLGDVILNEEDIVSKRTFRMVACPAPGASIYTIPKTIRPKISRQPLYFLRRARQGRGSILWLPRTLPLFLLPQYREPLHGGPLRKRDPRGSRNRAGHEDLRNDG